MTVLKKTIRFLIGIILLPWLLIGTLLLYWGMRQPPEFSPDPLLEAKTWTVVPPGNELRYQHMSNTDMIEFNGYLYLIHARSKWHLEDTEGSLVIHRSTDGTTWREIGGIILPGSDVRDPKFAVINDTLFLYFLPNLKFDPSPHTTYWASSSDGVNWTVPKELTDVTVRTGDVRTRTGGGWKLWRPKSKDGETWYVVASGEKERYDHGITVLLRSNDGIHWEEVSEVYTTHGNGEPTLEFLAEGSIISTLRCGSLGTPGYEFGNATANTIIATSSEPYDQWSYAHSFITRLDGATLFRIGDRIFAAGRNHLGPRIDTGNHLATKRTAVYEVKRDRLIHLLDLPSNGDTAYTGVVLKDDSVYISYYTCPVEKDYPWIVGICFLPKTEIRIAVLSQTGLVAYADKQMQTE